MRPPLHSLLFPVLASLAAAQGLCAQTITAPADEPVVKLLDAPPVSNAADGGLRPVRGVTTSR